MIDSPVVGRARARSISDILRLQAARNPGRIALCFEEQEDSFADLDDLVSRAASALRAAGVETGDRVALFSRNNRHFIILRFAIIRAGAIFTPINFMLNADEVAYILDHAGPSVVIAEDALCGVVEEALRLLSDPRVVRAYIPSAGNQIPARWISVEDWLSRPSGGAPAVIRDEDDPVQLMYTSGTESRPKGALLSSRALFAQYLSCIVDGGMDAEDVELHCLPLYHCAQLDCFLTVDLYIGAKSILMRTPDPARMLEAIERERVTKLFCPPTVWISLLRHPDFERRDLSSLTKGYYGASIMPVAVIEELSRRLPTVRLWNLYGQTELAPVAAILKPQEQFAKLGSAGRPVLNVETRVVDEHDRPVAVGLVGEIVHRSPQAMLGYYRDDEKTAEAFKGGWFHSGDLGRFDEDGYLYIVDRKKDMIKSGGENVASREVEEVIFAHPAVAEVAVFGLPDDKWIEAVTAAVVLRENAVIGAKELADHCRPRLASYKQPKTIYLVDRLPKNASGKILKRELRESYLR
ncbi:fatty acyl-CoA synthetase [Rhizorhabdus dicambivorans]|uniref:3-methylmercaptopropionyl-CoA ligase n=1 Tax=Rhizorhabdus dicambivorans TaxID=1850238 RepID=A0A2A4FYM7_9SPHN|nr:fatty acyl-CoA synthetase [Rhizorhabdus dicambivorans]ATE64191.1 acyl-CoA synthetase [Rhizorhabdus dicambivorans]PCE42537.1 acyl-CoA synthetase [Rhizorhabdus dicambivorans]